MAKRKEPKYEIDPADGLPREIVGPWVKIKQDTVTWYTGCASGARISLQKRWPKSRPALIDLYCGPGRCRSDGPRGEVLLGTSLAAALEARKKGAPFAEIHIADADGTLVEAAAARFRQQGFHALHTYVGPASATASQVARNVDQQALHLAFLDPFSLTALPFSVIEDLARLPRCDLIVHISIFDLRRNLELARGNRGHERFDLFAPGWRRLAAQNVGIDALRLAVWDLWRGKVRSLGFRDIKRVLPVRNSSRATIYWLVLCSRVPLAEKLWKIATDDRHQPDMFGG